MHRRFLPGLILGITITIAATHYFNKPKLHVHPKLKIADEVRWTTVEEIKNSLKNTPPINVGFDIDDTVIFPRVSFHVNFNLFCPFDNQPYKPDCTKKSHFWDQLNSSGDLSPAKEVGKQLIDMHKSRGDRIFFITAREKSINKPETMTETLSRIFNIKNLNKVIYLGLSVLDPKKPGKAKAIIENNIKLFYGDSDADIAAAIAAKIRGIRVMRAPNSQDNEEMPINGRYGEEVIIGSDI